MATTSLQQIIEKAQSKDRDFRYMATSDLLRVLQTEGFRADADTEAKVCSIILAQLEDASGDVSSLATKCLGLLVSRVSDERLVDMLSKLCDRVLSGKKEQQRDTAAIGLKTIVAEVHGSGPAPQMLVARAAPRLVEGVAQGTGSKDKDTVDIVNLCLELLTEITAKFGGLMPAPQQTSIRDAVLPELQEGRVGLRKRAIQCLAALSVHLDDEALGGLAGQLLQGLESQGKPDVSKTYLQAVTAISRSVGYRFGRYLDRAIPAAVAHCKGAGEDEEMREAGLQALESFVSRSPYEARPFVSEQVLPLALESLGHDPNYADDIGDEDDQDMDDEYDDDMSDEAYSDDEDMSWKVRRAAAKVVSAIVTAYPDMLDSIYPAACPRLVERFKEREESVKGDVFAAFCDLLRAVAAASRRYEGDSMVGPTGLLKEDVPRIMAAAVRQLREKSIKTRTGVFGMLTQLVAVLPDAVAGHVQQLVPGLQANLNDKTSTASGMKITTLEFLRRAMAANEASVFAPCAQDITPPVFACVGERYYKVTAEALRVCEQLCAVLRPDTSRPVGDAAQKLVSQLLACVLPKLSAPDQDQEVKEAAMSCGGTAVARLADVLPDESQQVIKTLLERLRNEITRLPSVRAFHVVAQSPLKPDLGGALEPAMAELTSFLRKSNRQLNILSLKALEALVVSYGSSCPPPALEAALGEAAPLVVDSDLVLAAQALSLACAVVHAQPSTAAAARDKVLPAAMHLVQSPLVQGLVLRELQALFQALSPGGDPQPLIQDLLKAGQAPGTSKTAQGSVAQCVAALAVSSPAAVAATVPGLIATATSGKGVSGAASEDAQRCALLCLGELGARADLAPYSPQLDQAVLGCLQSGSEEVAGAASAALGGVAAGNLQRFVPFLLDHIKQAAKGAPKQQYLLLKSLNEVVTSLALRQEGITAGAAAASPAPSLSDAQRDEVMALLFTEPEGEEEEVRNVVAACMGHMALLCPAQVGPRMEQQVEAASPAMRQVVVSAAKSMALERPHEVDEQLKGLLAQCLKLIGDPDRHVRRAALQTLSGAAHNKPGLVADQVPTLMPLVYQQTVVDASLIRTVDLGPFKHKIDDGLDLRKAAFECCDVLLDKCGGSIDLGAYITHLESGLADHYDVKMPCHLMLTKLANTAPGPLSAALPRLVGLLESTLNTKLKSDAVKQEVDRNEDMLRSCLRAVDAIDRMPDAEKSVPWRSFMNNVVLGNPHMQARFKAIQDERVEAEGAAADV